MTTELADIGALDLARYIRPGDMVVHGDLRDGSGSAGLCRPPVLHVLHDGWSQQGAGRRWRAEYPAQSLLAAARCPVGRPAARRRRDAVAAAGRIRWQLRPWAWRRLRRGT